MSLLWMEYEDEFQNLAETSFACEKAAKPEYFSRLDKRAHKIVYRDTRYNIDFLYTAFVLDDEKIMGDYARWLLRLMHPILKYTSVTQTAEYVTEHFDSIREAIREVVPQEKQARLMELMDCAQAAVWDEAEHFGADHKKKSAYEAEISQYMQSLLEKDSRNAMYLVQEFQKKGIPLDDIFAEIIAESMRRVGELWHTAQITVDTEHYCTSVTQMAMAQLYPSLFMQERRGKTMLCACPGTELHEMGARMVADIFENNGWDTIYLGAAVPAEYLLASIRENHPDLVALSVTMPQHLLDCRDIVEQIRKEFPDVKIAVGGGAFRSTHEIWKQWPIDIYTEDARELVERANEEYAQ